MQSKQEKNSPWYSNLWILDATITHARFQTRESRTNPLLEAIHRFVYRYPMVGVPMQMTSSQPKWTINKWLTHNRCGLWSIWDRDYPSGLNPIGQYPMLTTAEILLSPYHQDDSSSNKNKLNQNHLTEPHQFFSQLGFDPSTCDIVLLTAPRFLGIGFNPVSFWLLFQPCSVSETLSTHSPMQLKAVICHVNNTFGQFHQYICLPELNQFIHPHQHLVLEKVFHVSPFLPRQGQYHFRFDIQNEQIQIDINYHDPQTKTILKTRLSGTPKRATASLLKSLSLRYPTQIIRSLWLIHWQALKLWLKRISFYRIPTQGSRITKNNTNQ